MELTRDHFLSTMFHNFRRGFSRQEYIGEHKSLYGYETYSHYKNSTQIQSILMHYEIQYASGCGYAFELTFYYVAAHFRQYLDNRNTNVGFQLVQSLSIVRVNTILHIALQKVVKSQDLVTSLILGITRPGNVSCRRVSLASVV